MDSRVHADSLGVKKQQDLRYSFVFLGVTPLWHRGPWFPRARVRHHTTPFLLFKISIVFWNISKFGKLTVSIRSMPFRGPFSRRMSWNCKNWCYRNQKDNWLLITSNFEYDKKIFEIELKAQKIQPSIRWSRKSSDYKKIWGTSWPWRIYLRKSWLFSKNKTDFSVINVKFKWF